jgi:hypothetical protein
MLVEEKLRANAHEGVVSQALGIHLEEVRKRT